MVVPYCRAVRARLGSDQMASSACRVGSTGSVSWSTKPAASEIKCGCPNALAISRLAIGSPPAWCRPLAKTVTRQHLFHWPSYFQLREELGRVIATTAVASIGRSRRTCGGAKPDLRCGPRDAALTGRESSRDSAQQESARPGSRVVEFPSIGAL